MQKTITEELYNMALTRIEELLPLVNDDTPADNPLAVELCLFSDMVEEYEDEHFPIKVPTFAEVIEQRLRETKIQKKTLAQKIGVSPSRISDFLSERAEPSLSQARMICKTLNIEPRIAMQL